MKKYTLRSTLTIITLVVLSACSPAFAGTEWDEVLDDATRALNAANQLNTMAQQIPPEYGEYKSQLTTLANRTHIFALTVFQNAEVVYDNNDNVQSIEWIEEYAGRCKRDSRDAESIAHQLERRADRDDNDAVEELAEAMRHKADFIGDRMRSILWEID